MSYLGSPPASQFFAPGTDTFSGDGTTVAFTLSRNVGTVNDILVVVNNVDQQPTAYTVSVSTLTFTAAPSAGTNNIYVRYLSTNLITIAPQQGSVTPASLSTPNALYWDTSGNVGVGTTAPSYKLDVIGASRSVVNFGNSYSASYLASALGTANGQLAGISFLPTFVATPGDNIPRRAADIWAGFNGGNWGTQYLAFGVGAAANDVGNSTPERMRIDSSGNLLVGTTTVRAKLTIVGDGTTLYLGPGTFGAGSEGGEINFGRGTDGAAAWSLDVLSGASPTIRLINGSAVGVQVTNGATAWSAYSDIRLKTNITPLRSVLPDIQSIECINYHLDGIDTDETPIRIGVSAQSLVGKFDEVLDETQVKGKDGLYYSVRYSDMVPYLVKAIQEQQAMIEELKTKVAALEAR